MDNKINIAEILLSMPIGTKLYSPTLGEVTLDSVCMDAEYPIGVLDKDANPWGLDQYGRISEHGECMLFPSMNNRDWLTFIEQKKGRQFKPFQQVLVRNSKDEIWLPRYYAHKCGVYHICTDSHEYFFCIPYEGNEYRMYNEIAKNNDNTGID